jgi:hypothetical protein
MHISLIRTDAVIVTYMCNLRSSLPYINKWKYLLLKFPGTTQTPLLSSRLSLFLYFDFLNVCERSCIYMHRKAGVWLINNHTPRRFVICAKAFLFFTYSLHTRTPPLFNMLIIVQAWISYSIIIIKKLIL